METLYRFLLQLSVIVPSIVLLWPIRQFYINKNTDEKYRQLENYHKLISKLLPPPNKKNDDMVEQKNSLEQQMAILFELREFKKYHSFTCRIIESSLKGPWKNEPEPFKEEAKLTILYIKFNPIQRLIYNCKNCLNII
jgi:hypothetical protein